MDWRACFSAPSPRAATGGRRRRRRAERLDWSVRPRPQVVWTVVQGPKISWVAEASTSSEGVLVGVWWMLSTL